MKWSNIKWILLREVRDQLRDRRTVFTIAVLPLLLYPLLGMSFLQIAQFSREHRTPVLILGADSLPDDPRLLADGHFSKAFCSGEESRLMELTVRDHPPAEHREANLGRWSERAIQSGEFDAVVFFPPDFAEKLGQFRTQILQAQADLPNGLEVPEPEIFVNTASDKSRMARDRVERVLHRWRLSIVRDNLRQRNVPVAATEPFHLKKMDVARERNRRAALWSKILPFVVLIWALTGAFYPAIDLCAGEKERGTLETLLCSPAQRSEIVCGKLLTIMAFSMATSVLNLLSMGLTGIFIIGQIQRLGEIGARVELGTPPVAAMGWLLLALVPISALFSALSLAIAAFARSSKEGQYYLMPLLLVTLPLMMLPLLPTAELDMGTSLIPVTGMMLLLKSLIEGQYVDALRYALPVVGTTAICCLLAIRWAVDQFNDESVLFRESERWGLGLWVRHVMRERGETPSLGEAVLCGVLLLLIRFFTGFLIGTPDSWPGFATTTIVTLVAFIAAPALLMTVVLTRSPRKTLLLQLPRPAAIPMALLLAVVIHPAGLALAKQVKDLYPISDEVFRQMQAIGTLIDQAPSIWSVLLALALVPAICEELAFRGFILSGLRHMGHKWAAIFASSIFFGAAHGILQQSLTACAVGIVIAYIAVQTGSLLPAILFHVAYNSLSLLPATTGPEIVSRYPALKWIFEATGDGVVYQWPVVGISVLLASGLLLWFRSLPYEHSPEESFQETLDHQSVHAAAE